MAGALECWVVAVVLLCAVVVGSGQLAGGPCTAERNITKAGNTYFKI